MSTLQKLSFFVRSEPVAVRNVLAVAATIGASVGFELDVEQALGFLSAIALFATWGARAKVTPTDPEVLASKIGTVIVRREVP